MNFYSSCSKWRELTNDELGCKAATGDSQVVSVLLSVHKAGVSIPEFEVSTGAASHKHLGTWREAASHDAGLAYGGTSARGGMLAPTWVWLVLDFRVYQEVCKIRRREIEFV